MIIYEHLCGVEFDLMERNCYHSLREIYKDNWNIDLTDYPCPVDYCERRMDLYAQIASSEGFTPVLCHPRDYRPGDVFLMAIDSTVGNHVGVLLDDGQMFHHLLGQLSGVTTWGGMFRNTTIGVYRHKDVPLEPAFEEQVDFRTLLPPSIRLRLEALEASMASEHVEQLLA